tara:strand:- start:229 stop:636 length:408 start_codon:yes stop_codon:yes gene_type:complete
MRNPEKTRIVKEEAIEIMAIKKVLYMQQEYWNNGNIDGFMEGYWNSEKLIFTSLSNEPSFRWKNTFELYKNSYPKKESIGELEFELLDLKLISKNTASLKGKWELLRESINTNGYHWLDLQKFDKRWFITKDSAI